MSRVIKVVARKDGTNEPEEFTWDLFPIVAPDATAHLTRDGLPKVGSRILPGMILVGKIGKSRLYDARRQPTDLELHGLPFEVLKKKYGDMWYDASVYAEDETSGVVENAFIEVKDCQTVATVVLAEQVME